MKNTQQSNRTASGSAFGNFLVDFVGGLGVAVMKEATTAMQETTTKTDPAFAIGNFTTCQFGNKFDSDWNNVTSANAHVEILDIQPDLIGNSLYLVRKLNTQLLGVATVSHSASIQGKLYCTRAVAFDGSWPGIYTEATARRRLGF